MVGLLLGDAYLKIGKNQHNIRIGFKQSIINFPFLWEVFNQLIHFFSAMPRFEIATLSNGKKYGQVILETRAYPVFSFFLNLFVVNGNKVIKEELFFYFTPVSLAYWIMCDGVSTQYGLLLCTDCFTVKEVVILMNILIIKYDLDCTIHYNKGKPRIYIKANSMPNLRNLVGPYIIPFSAYKLKKGNRF